MLAGAILTLQCLWVLALPAFFGLDEFDHAYRAASVADGHWQAGTAIPADGRGFLVRVPAELAAAAHDACATLTYTGPDNCTATTPPDSRGTVLIASAAATYNPVWYFVVGTVAAPFSGTTSLFVMRVTGMLLCDAMLVTAGVFALRRQTSAWPFLGIALVATPTLLYATTVAAPNGLGYSAGVLLWSAGLRLARSQPAAMGSSLGAITVAASVVMVTHTTGVLWICLAAVGAGPLLWPSLRQAVRHRFRALLLAGTTIALVALACTAWILLADTNSPSSERSGTELGPMPGSVLVSGPTLWTLQAVATLRFRDTPAPLVVYALAMPLLAALLAYAFRVARRPEKVTLLVIAVLANLVPLVLTFLTYDTLGSAWQGRYALPLSVGFVLVTVEILSRSRQPPGVQLGVVALMTVIQLATIYGAFKESQTGYLANPLALVLLGGGLYLGFLARGVLLARSATEPRRADHCPTTVQLPPG